MLRWPLTLLLALSSLAVARDRLNVVFILIDDLSHYGVTAYGADRISEWRGLFENRPFATPRIDRLATEGLRCDNAHVYPLCEPTRVALMTGQYNSRNFLRPKALHESQITFGDLFRRAGYATGIFGKWKQTRGTREVPGRDYIGRFGWDRFCCFDVVTEGQRYLNPTLVVDGEVRDYRGRTDRDPQTGRRWYGPDICNRAALDFLDRHRDEPFFLYYPMLLVHDEHMPTPDTRPAEVFDTWDETRDDRRFFPDMLAYMDRLIGRVVDRVEQLGLRRRTLIVVMGDNGTKEPFTHVLPDGRPYPGGKGDTRDNGTHVPLILSCPGRIPDGGPERIRSYAGLVDVTDLLPTLCEAAGVPLPAAVDGISFWPQVIGTPGEHRPWIYAWYNGNHRADDTGHLLRYAFTRDFKRYAPDADFPAGRFFDLRRDPLERAGDRRVHVAWVHYHHSGLDLSALDPTQRGAYDALGRVLDAQRYVAVTGLDILGPARTLTVGQRAPLRFRVTPPAATRSGVVWASSDPRIATVDKFGTVTACRSGTTTIRLASWDDAWPVAANAPVTVRRDGLCDTVTVKVRAAVSEAPASTSPNVVIVYADDMGFGDLGANNPASKIPTPHLDRLAAQGIRFTDGHSSSGICTPSRFALLTGQHHWRRFHGIVNPFGASVFEPNDFTLAKMFRAHGYATAAFGKWHLGWDWQALRRSGAPAPNKARPSRPEDYDWTRAIPDGPLAQGFDHYFGDGTINFPPYAWVENDRVVPAPTVMMDTATFRPVPEGNWEFRPGPMAVGWDPYRVLPTVTDRAADWIRRQRPDRPLFLYLALPSPHAPIVPNDDYRGRSQAGPYGDYVAETDAMAGRILAALDETGRAERTLVVFTSDNGAEKYAYERLRRYRHWSSGPLRGVKRDVWEGGHRVPFLIRWPGVIAAGRVSDETVSQVDLAATFAAVLGHRLGPREARDSYNLLPLLRGRSYVRPLRRATVQNTYAGAFALRQGDWLYIDARSGEHSRSPAWFNTERGYAEETTPGLLYNLRDDPAQHRNRYTADPERVAAMKALLDAYRAGRPCGPHADR